jgi:hypothetical protein
MRDAPLSTHAALINAVQTRRCCRGGAGGGEYDENNTSFRLFDVLAQLASQCHVQLQVMLRNTVKEL